MSEVLGVEVWRGAEQGTFQAFAVGFFFILNRG
jgi:hypothetical protein